MGTKNNPGRFDCYANADPDEPMFILLGRDRHAPALVRLWAALRALDEEKQGKVEEAMNCANEMERWREGIGRKPCNQHIEAALQALALALLDVYVGSGEARQPSFASRETGDA